MRPFTAAGHASPLPARRLAVEAVALGLLSAAVYGGVGTVLYQRAPDISAHLNAVFDADPGYWVLGLTRPQGPHRTRLHPIITLLLNPAGFGLRELLHRAHFAFAGRLAAAWLCALGGGLAVAAFRVLLDRLGIARPRALPFTLLLAASATQVVFASVPESYAFSAAALVLVFAVAAGRQRGERARVFAGVLAFGITSTNLVAVALARATGVDWSLPLRAARRVAVHVGAVVLVVAALSLAQRLAYRTTDVFFMRGPLPTSVTDSLFVPRSASEAAWRAGDLADNLLFAALAPGRPDVSPAEPDKRLTLVAVPLRRPTVPSAAHALVWALMLGAAALGLRTALRSPVVAALALWLGFTLLLHSVFGDCLFLYSGHWAFAVLAVVAAGVEVNASRAPRAIAWALAVLVVLEVLTSASLVATMLREFAG